MAEPPEGRVAELGPEFQLLLVEDLAVLAAHRGHGVVVGMERLHDEPAPRADRLGCRREQLEGALARAEVGHPQEAVEPDEADGPPLARPLTTQDSGRANDHLGAGIAARHGQAREAPAHRGLHTLGVPAEGLEPVTAAAGAALGKGLDPRAQPAGHTTAVAPELEGAAARGAPENASTGIAPQRSPGPAHH